MSILSVVGDNYSSWTVPEFRFNVNTVATPIINFKSPLTCIELTPPIFGLAM